MTVTVGAPASIGGVEGRRVLADFYGELLGMVVIDEGWLRIASPTDRSFQLALDGDGWSDERPPRFGDPDHPQQLHLDIHVPDVVAAMSSTISRGAAVVHRTDVDQVLADPAGHPFCLERGGDTAHIHRLVFDCFSPRALASFYEGLFGLDPSARVHDGMEWVELDLLDDRFPHLAFQQATFVASRWPDPAYPSQLHVDWRFADKGAAVERVERLGAIRLPKLADTEIFADPSGHPFCL
jgi:hypothetical protein